METIEINTRLIEAVYQYLVKRPYDEVAPLIAGLNKDVKTHQDKQPRDAKLPE
jgi:hypothetical protein